MLGVRAGRLLRWGSARRDLAKAPERQLAAQPELRPVQRGLELRLEGLPSARTLH
jgi:hypothetical protein